MKKALVVGINNYQNISSLYGCVNDALNISRVLKRNADQDETINFHVKLLTTNESNPYVNRITLRSAVQDVFNDDCETVLFYFAGHGYIDSTGGYLCSSDCESGDDGLGLQQVMNFAHRSKANNKIIILDSCHSGVAGKNEHSLVSELSEGMTVLTASTADQYANEIDGSGIFTNLLIDALSGAAANLLGDVTPGSIYAHIDQSLGAFTQRPVFKTNVKSFVSLRKVHPALRLVELRKISKFFPKPGFNYKLDPSFEPERSEFDKKSLDYIPPDKQNTKIFAILQKFNRVNLVVPVDAPHMWHAAMWSKSCKLTVLGEHYRQLASKGLI